MKKLFTILCSLGSVVPTIAYNICDQKNVVLNMESSNSTESLATFSSSTNIWDNVGINHEVITNKTGTDDKEDTKTAAKATAKINWDNTISKPEYVNAHGYFSFHTYKDALYKDTLELILDKTQTSEYTRVWVFDDTHEAWSGWGHQTARIKLTLKAIYNDDEGITSLEVISYIYARTAGSVHSCSTLSRVDTIRFLIGFKK